MNALDRTSERALRAPSGFVVVIQMRDGSKFIARVVRPLEAMGTTLRIRTVGQSASQVLFVREVASARLASRGEIQVAVDRAAQSSGVAGVVSASSRSLAGSSTFTPPASDPGNSSTASPAAMVSGEIPERF